MMRRMMLAAIMVSPVTIYAQSTSENYILEKSFLDSDGTGYISSLTYYDGVGLPVEHVTTGSGQGHAVYSLTDYDAKGREAKAYLPVPIGQSLDFVNAEAMENHSAAYYDNDQTAFYQNHYDTVDRIISEDIPGSLWRSNSMAKTYQYGTNSASDYVLHYEAPLTAISLVSPGDTEFTYYPEGSLTKETVSDADGKTLTVFKDFHGNTVLERREIGDTYFVYNTLGQLRYVLSPQYQQSRLKALYSYEYRYDTRGNLVKRILPGCEYTQYWYDRERHLTFSQDAQLRERGLYRFMLYDQKGRLAVQGTCTRCNRSIGGAELHVYYAGSSSNFMSTGYSLNATGFINTSDAVIEKIYYYDGYNFLAGPHAGVFHELSTDVSTTGRGRLTGSVVSSSDGNNIYCVNYYDVKGNLVRTLSMGLDGYREETTTGYSFTNRPESSSSLVNVNYGEDFAVSQRYTYNMYNNLPEDAVLSLSHGTDTVSTTIRYGYDDLNRPVSITRPNQAGSVTYTYDMHGWLTSISTNSFHENLYYADGLGTPYYNGNISSMTWSNSSYDQLRGYKFYYDGLNRMTDAIYGERSDLNNRANRYNEHLEYDMNGNITRLQRRGRKQDGQYGKIDNLNITLLGNQLYHITDDAAPLLYEGAFDFNNASTGRSDFQYNSSGSLISDTGRGIAMIEYDNGNNPRRIQFTNGNVTSYVYSSEGRKLRTVHYTAMPNITVAIGETHQLTESEILCKDSTDYLLGGSLILQNGRIDKYLFAGGYAQGEPGCTTIARPFLFIMEDEPTQEELERYMQLEEQWSAALEAARNSDTFSFRYYNRDHLGNNREVVDEAGNILQVTNYYPFGTPYCDAVSTINPDTQPFKYNGKELDMMHGMDTYDYGARQYNSILSTWDRVDPMAEKYYHISPYVYCMNNPVNAIDPDGRKVRPIGLAELTMILNTLPKETWNYVQIDNNGFINSNLINSFNSDSNNFNSLKQMVNSSQTVVVKFDDSFLYADEKGNIESATMQYNPYAPEYGDEKDVNGETISGTSTGESGFMGKTLFPDRDGYQNSPTNDIIVIVNKYLSSPAASEIFSHEGYGHALLYIINGGNHEGASHQVKGMKDKNSVLVDMIIRAKQETIKNMRDGKN